MRYVIVLKSRGWVVVADKDEHPMTFESEKDADSFFEEWLEPMGWERETYRVIPEADAQAANYPTRSRREPQMRELPLFDA